MRTRLTGTDEVIRNLNRAVGELEKVTLSGLIRAAIVPMRDADTTPPLTPVVTGNLRSSRFLVTSRGVENTPEIPAKPQFKGSDANEMASQHSTVQGSGAAQTRAAGRPMVIFGYSAVYARRLHESVGYNFQMPGAGAKWLQAALRRNHALMLEKIAIEGRKVTG